MRKFVSLFAAIFAFGLVGAQQAEAQQNMVGVKGGFISANTDVTGFNNSSRTGLGFGGFLQVMVAESFSIQPEALYLQKGSKISDGGTEATGKFSYLQVPILVQFHLPTSTGVSPRLFAGPSIAFELACDYEESDAEFSASTSCENAGLETKSADFGIVFGAGVDLPAGSMVVTLDGRYDLGVTDVGDVSGFEAKNRSWEFFAGVGFPFGP